MFKKIVFLVISFLITNIGYSQYKETGIASFYADKFEGKSTASGEKFSQYKMTAAHKTLPFGSKVRVTNLVNGKIIIVVINDRGPFTSGRIIDLSLKGAKMLNFVGLGKVKVKIELLNPNTKVTEKVISISEMPKTSKVINSKPPVKIATGHFYKVSSERVIPKGFGVQVASYQEAANLIEKSNLIKAQTLKDVFVNVGNVNESKVYKIIIGSFTSMNDARKYNEQIQIKFPGSFVVTF